MVDLLPLRLKQKHEVFHDMMERGTVAKMRRGGRERGGWGVERRAEEEKAQEEEEGEKGRRENEKG